MEPDSEGVYHGNGWRYVPQNSTREDRDTLYLDGDSFDLSDAFIRCHVIISNKTTVKNTNFGCYENPSGDAKITNSGILQNCEFFDSIIINNNRIETSIFENCDITNSGNFNDCLFALKGTDSFFFSSMSASNSFSSLSLENSISSPSFSGSGKYTDCLFNFDPSVAGLSDVTVHTLQRADQNELYAFLANYPDNFTAYSASCFYTVGSPKIKTVYIDSDQVYYYNVRFINGIPSASYDSEFYHDNVRWYVFTVQDGDAVLMSDAKELTIDSSTGKPDTTGMTSYNGVYYGEGWKYENDTLTLESGSYDFSTTKPTTKDGDVLKLVNCKVVVENGATITGGHFRAMSNYGTVENSLLSNNTIENCDGGTMTNCLFCRTTPPVGVANYHKLTEVNNNVFDVTLPNASDIFSGWTTYYFTGTPTLVVCLAVYGGFNKLNYINGDEHYGNLTGPDSYGYYTFTPPEEENIVLNREPYATDLVITEGGIPDSTNREPVYEDGKVVGYKGTGWKYKNDTLTLESGSYRFIHEDGDSTSFTTDNISCNVIVQNGVSVTGGYFIQSLVNYGTIERAAIYHDLENHNTIRNSYISSNTDQIINSGSMGDCLFTHRPSVFKTYSLSEVENYPISATLNGVSASTVQSEFYFTGTPTLEVQLAKDGDFKKVTYINGKKNYGGLKGDDPYLGYAFTVEKEEDIVLNDTIIHEPFTMTNGYPTASNGGKTACKGEGWEYILGNPEHGDFLFLSDAQIDFSKISDGSPVECKLFIGHGVAVQGGTFNGKVINNGGGILGGTFNGAVENHGTIKNGVFNGAVENHGTIENGVFNGAVTNIDPGTVSDSITGTGTLNGKPITPNAYTLTVTGGGLVNGKTSAVVEAGDEVRLTVGEMQEGMSFNYWDLPTALIKALTDSSSGGFSNKVEPLTFTMPDLSKYTEDKSFTIRLDIRPAELPDDDDGPSVLGTMATVAVGGAAAGILVWQGVSLGVDSYLQLSLPGGVPVPTNRRELVVLLWETAGKPDVVLPALYGDVSTEDGELQKATRWAIDNGLVKPADDSDASRFDPDRYVTKYDVFGAWLKLKKLMK